MPITKCLHELNTFRHLVISAPVLSHFGPRFKSLRPQCVGRFGTTWVISAHSLEHFGPRMFDWIWRENIDRSASLALILCLYRVWLNVCSAPHHTAIGKIQYHSDGNYRTLLSRFPFVARICYRHRWKLNIIFVHKFIMDLWRLRSIFIFMRQRQTNFIALILSYVSLIIYHQFCYSIIVFFRNWYLLIYSISWLYIDLETHFNW